LLLLAAESAGPGRGENPSDVGGIVIIVGIALLIIVVLAVGLWVVLRHRSGV
jgi:hypothetical protein